MAGFPPPTSLRPPIMGSRFVASTGHYLATSAALRILDMGGNAIDAGIAAGICINVLQPDMTNVGGVAPIILYSAKEEAVFSISGVGYWPAAASREYFLDTCDGSIPPGIHRTVLPAAVDCWLTALERFGTLTLAEVSAPAIELAENGFPVYPFLQANIEAAMPNISQWQSTMEIYAPTGRAPRSGERLVQSDLAQTLRKLVEAEEGSRHINRETAIRAARDRFYKGDIAEQIATFFEEQDGFLTRGDLRNFSVDIEPALHVSYRDVEVFGCQPWCQGPVALETLAILNGYDMRSLGQNSADSLHLILESLKSAFADREEYYGDPKFVDVPVEGLLSPDYVQLWRERIHQDRATPGMPEPGDPWAFEKDGSARHQHRERPRAFAAPTEPDTSYVCVVDEQGNAFSATPSDVMAGAPIVPGLGIIVSNRGIQSWLDASHPSSLEPGKRPRLTPSPGLIMKNGRPYAAYGTPGHDVQPQAMVQFIVNLVDHGMDPQAAVESPRLSTFSFPGSSHPHPYTPGLVQAEGRISRDVLEELSRRGHQIEDWPDWAPPAGSVCAALIDEEQGTLIGAADPRRVAYAAGW